MLVVGKLTDDHGIIKSCVESDVISLSTTLNEPVSYNSIDKKTHNLDDFVKNNETIKPTTISNEESDNKIIPLNWNIKYDINSSSVEFK